MAEQRIRIDNSLIARNHRRPVTASSIKAGDVRLSRGQNFLHLAESLLGILDQNGVRIVGQHAAIFFLRVRRLYIVTVRLIHLAKVNVSNAHLRFCGLGRIRKEHPEVGVLAFSLRQSGCAALLVPAIRNRQLGAHLILRVRIRVQHSLQIQTSDVKVALLQGYQRLIVKLLIRQARVHADQCIRTLFLLQRLLRVLRLDNLVVLLAAAMERRGPRDSLHRFSRAIGRRSGRRLHDAVRVGRGHGRRRRHSRILLSRGRKSCGDSCASEHGGTQCGEEGLLLHQA